MKHNVRRVDHFN